MGGLCLYWGRGWAPRVSRVHSLLVNLKHEWDLRYEKGKAGSLKQSVICVTQSFLTVGLCGWGDPVLYLVV